MKISGANEKIMREIQWHSEADSEFRSAARHYQRREEGLGDRFGRAILAAVDHAAVDPKRYQWIDGQCQFVRAKKFPYSVIYQEKEGGIRIVAIMHQHRRPGYWKERSGDWRE